MHAEINETVAAAVREQCASARRAARAMALCSTADKDDALRRIADSIRANAEGILAANALDMEAGHDARLGTRLDRLLLTTERLDAICSDIHDIVSLPDPVNQEIGSSTGRNGLHVRRVRVPLGVVGIIYEARPNVTVDAAVLCLKSGNSVVLKGGSDALNSNLAVVAAIRQGLAGGPLPVEAVQLLEAGNREVTNAFLRMRGLIDVIIPRGGQELIRFAQENALVPVIETGASVVHAYVDEDVEIEQAVALIENSKTRRVSICNALDTLLVHRAVLEEIAVPLGRRLTASDPQVEVRADSESYDAFAKSMAPEKLKRLDPERDFGTEFLDYTLAVATVGSMEEAIDHIDRYSLKHTEAIFTTNGDRASTFQRTVDAACIMHNASTQFTDGGEFGLGAEIGISTQKLHVRGPFALEGLTTMKWMVEGEGQLRP